MAIEIVDFPIENKVIVHSYVSLPEGQFQKKTWEFMEVMEGKIARDLKTGFHLFLFYFGVSFHP